MTKNCQISSELSSDTVLYTPVAKDKSGLIIICGVKVKECLENGRFKDVVPSPIFATTWDTIIWEFIADSQNL